MSLCRQGKFFTKQYFRKNREVKKKMLAIYNIQGDSLTFEYTVMSAYNEPQGTDKNGSL